MFGKSSFNICCKIQFNTVARFSGCGGQNAFLGEQGFCFIICSKQIFLGTKYEGNSVATGMGRGTKMVENAGL